MAYFPFMMDISKKRCLVVGGGSIALHKVNIILEFGAIVRVVAADICPQIKEIALLNSLLELQEKEFQDEDIEGTDFVIAATNKELINLHISELCKKRGIPINVVDVKQACSFIFPAIIKEKDMVIAISSGGSSPAAVSYLKDKLRQHIPDYYGAMMEELAEYRDYICENIETAKLRRKIFYELVEYSDEHHGEVSDALVFELVEKYKKLS